MPMKVLVAYDSRKGTTRAVAEWIARVATGWTPRVEVHPVGGVRPEEAAEADVLFLGGWVRGLLVVGVGPSGGASSWARALPSLEGKLAAVFCTYDVNPRQTLPILAAELRDKGAEVVAGHASRRRNRFAGVDDFTMAVMGEARSRLPPRSAGRPALR
jgi:menaquinone-dependent protoporphyrinogen IX oxidase